MDKVLSKHHTARHIRREKEARAEVLARKQERDEQYQRGRADARVVGQTKHKIPPVFFDEAMLKANREYARRVASRYEGQLPDKFVYETAWEAAAHLQRKAYVRDTPRGLVGFMLSERNDLHAPDLRCGFTFTLTCTRPLDRHDLHPTRNPQP